MREILAQYAPALVIAMGTLLTIMGTFWAAVRQTSNNRVLTQKNERIRELSEKVSETLTGGDSFCYLQLIRFDGDPTLSQTALIHSGKYPLYDVSLTIIDPDEPYRMEKGKLDWNDVINKQHVIRVGNLSPNQTTIVQGLTLPQRDIIRLNILISARNGFISERLRSVRQGDKWAQALTANTVGTTDAAKVLIEMIDDAFPRNAEGKVEW